MRQAGFYVGIDGGGTKSTALLEFEDGRPLVYVTGGPLNVCGAPYGEVESNLVQLLNQMEDIAGDLAFCRGMGIGVAGFTNPHVKPFIETRIAARIPQVPVMVDSDALAALYGAHLNYEGVVLISGTGSVCYGASGAAVHQSGGGGHLIDDEGSGYAIGRDILSAVLQSLDGRLPPTLLLQSVKEKSGFTTKGDIIEYVYDKAVGKDAIAAFATLLTNACAEGDSVALAIANKAVNHLIKLINAVTIELNLPDGPLAFGGSILKKEPFVRESLCKKLATRWPNMLYYEAKADAAAGAVLMARRASGKEIS